MNLKKLRALSHSWRWNYHPRIRQESVAEHSYWTAVYVLRMLKDDDFSGHEILQVVKYALFHDAAEAITGDLPGPVKRKRDWDEVESAALAEMEYREPFLTIPEKRIVKAADLVSALVFADEEVRMGNWYFKQIRAELLYALHEMHIDVADKLIEELGFNYEDMRQYVDDMSHL
jgi:5'-deoxynucleotidase